MVFDPFAGSGTIGKAAMGLNRYFFLTEKKREYVERMREDLGEKNGFLNNDNITNKVSFCTVKEFERDKKINHNK